MKDLFAKIIKGEIPSLKVYEDEHTFAFLDINPVNPGHTLVVPKEQCNNIYDMPEETLAHVMKTVQKLAIAVKKATNADGINITMNNDGAAGQIITDHAHIHIIPRFKGDGFVHWKGDSYKEGEGAKVAEQIKASL